MAVPRGLEHHDALAKTRDSEFFSEAGTHMLARRPKMSENTDLTQLPSGIRSHFGQNEIHRYFDASVCRGRNNKPEPCSRLCHLEQADEHVLHVFKVGLDHLGQ